MSETLQKKLSNNWSKVKKTLCTKLKIEDIISTDLFENYMNQGWLSITKSYKTNTKELTNNYFDTLSHPQKKLTLEILGSIRKYLVDIFYLSVSKTENNEYIAVGSNNITSDYDISILGPDSNEIMWKMFNLFLNKYQDALPFSFDTNIYCSPLYIHTNHNNIQLNYVLEKSNLFPRIDYGKRKFTLAPLTYQDIREELIWACIKLISFNIDPRNEILKIIITLSKEYQYNLESIREKHLLDRKKLEVLGIHKLSKETQKISINYYLQYIYQQPIQNYIYSNMPFNPYFKLNNKLMENLFFYSNIVNYFSSESYYTSSAVNSIVIENQMEEELDYSDRKEDIRKLIYITAAIENLGDMFKHIKNETGGLDKILIKYSKYIYRFYYVISKLGYERYRLKALEIKKYILPFRQNIDKKCNHFDIIFYENEKKEEYIEKIKNIFIYILEKELKNISNIKQIII